MGKIIIGNQYGKWFVKARDDERSDYYYLCVCNQCNEISSLQCKQLLKDVSCRCNRPLNFPKLEDLTGKTIGNFQVIKLHRIDHHRYWECICLMCGKSYIYTTNQITHNKTCGCNKSTEIARACSVKQAKKIRTNVGICARTEANANNKLGIRGVYFEKRSGKYRANITFRKKQYTIGRYNTIEEAAYYRKKAEKIRNDAINDLLEFEFKIKSDDFSKGFYDL